MDEDFGTPHVAEKFESEPDALGRAADESRNIRHDEGLPVNAADLDYAQDRLQRRERVIGDLGSGG